MKNEKLTEEECKRNLKALQEKGDVLNNKLKYLYEEIHTNQTKIRSIQLFLEAFKVYNK